LGVGRFPKQGTYTDYPTGDSDLTPQESLSRVESSYIRTPNAQTPKIALSRGCWRSGFAQKRAECTWHLDQGERVPRELCAGCRSPIMPGDDVLDLADDNRVHFDADYRCLLAWRDCWRSAARAHLTNRSLTCSKISTSTTSRPSPTR